MFHIRHLLDFRTFILFYNNFIHCYNIIWCSSVLFTVLSFCDQIFLQPAKTSSPPSLQAISKLNFHKMLGNTWVESKTNDLPLPLLSSYFACVSAHTIKTGQCPSYITSHFVPSSFKATRYQHKPPSSHYSKLNHYLVSSYNSLPLSLPRSHASAFKLKLKQYLFTTL